MSPVLTLGEGEREVEVDLFILRSQFQRVLVERDGALQVATLQHLVPGIQDLQRKVGRSCRRQ